MAMLTFTSDGNDRNGYLALPPGGKGSGILVLHAWWGLTDFFKSTCDRLAAAGYVAFAPDLFQGRTAATVEAAKLLVETCDHPAVQATARTALQLLQFHPAVQGRKLDALGFSFGAAYAVLLDQLAPGALSGIVLFYGGSDMDLAASKTPLQCHFAEKDEWEPLENVKKIAAPNAGINIYPGTGHWFFESNRPEAYNPEAAALAWKRSLEFFGKTLA